MGLLDLLGFKVWWLQNQDTGQLLKGQFEPVDQTKNIAANYAKHKALNKQVPIVHFLSGEADTITFQARLYRRDFLFSSVDDDMKTLESWSKRDVDLGRPPILSFWVGDGHLGLKSCVIENLSAVYAAPTALGASRDVTVNISLLQYEPYSLESESGGETRYHRAKIRDYYEILTFEEYGDPLLGDVIRKRHPTKPNIKIADIIKLPSYAVIRKELIQPKSIPLETAYGKKETQQRTLRLAVFDRTNREFTSHVIRE